MNVDHLEQVRQLRALAGKRTQDDLIIEMHSGAALLESTLSRWRTFDPRRTSINDVEVLLEGLRRSLRELRVIQGGPDAA